MNHQQQEKSRLPWTTGSDHLQLYSVRGFLEVKDMTKQSSRNAIVLNRSTSSSSFFTGRFLSSGGEEWPERHPGERSSETITRNGYPPSWKVDALRGREKLSSSEDTTRSSSKQVPFDAEGEDVEIDPRGFTTVMLRNCPNSLSRDELMDILDAQGLRSRFDFVYVPTDFMRNAGLGYAFVNFTTHQNALQAMEAMAGFGRWNMASEKVCAVSWGRPIQGLEKHIERVRNSPVMHWKIPEKFKPVMLKDGVRQEFPPATKRIRPPRLSRRTKLAMVPQLPSEQ